jgi:hypothetical protein
MNLLRNVTFRNVGTAIGTDNGVGRGAPVISVGSKANLHVESVTFDNVLTPFDLSGVKSGLVAGTRVVNDPKLRNDRVAV